MTTNKYGGDTILDREKLLNYIMTLNYSLIYLEFNWF